MATRKGAPHVAARWVNADGTLTHEAFVYLTQAPFESKAQTIVNGTVITLEHGLGARPRAVTALLQNIAPELGYAEHDLASIPTFEDAGDNGVSTSADRRYVYLTVGAQGIRLMQRTGAVGQYAAIDNAKWGLVVVASASP